MEATIAAQMKALDDQIVYLESTKQQMLDEKKSVDQTVSPRGVCTSPIFFGISPLTTCSTLEFLSDLFFSLTDVF